MQTQLKILGLGVSAVMLMAMSHTEKPVPTHAGTGLPFCSAKVTDKCIQRTDARRTDAEKAAAPKPM